MKNNHKHIMLLVMLFLLAFFLSSCTTKTETTTPSITTPAVEWDPTFVNELKLDPSIMNKLNDSVQNINLKSSINGVTVHVKQTLGDAKTLYIALDVLFPDDVDVGLISDGNNQDNVTVSSLPETLKMFKGKTDYDDTDARSSYKKIPPEGSIEIETRGINRANNSVSFFAFC